MDCVSINTKAFNRKKETTIKKAQMKKCESRIEHPYKPCKILGDKCVTAKQGTGKCNDVRPKPIGTFKNKMEQKTDLVKRCVAQGKAIDKKCTVPNKKRLVCHESKRAKKIV